MSHSLIAAGQQVSIIDELVPFIAGLATQLLGSIVQYGFLYQIRDRATISAQAQNELLRDGDLVQLLCTATAIVSSAIIALRDRETFLVVTIFVAVIVIAGALILFRAWDPHEYRRYSAAFLTPAFDTSLLFCLAGGAAAYLGHS